MLSGPCLCASRRTLNRVHDPQRHADLLERVPNQLAWIIERRFIDAGQLLVYGARQLDSDFFAELDRHAAKESRRLFGQRLFHAGREAIEPAFDALADTQELADLAAKIRDAAFDNAFSGGVEVSVQPTQAFVAGL